VFGFATIGWLALMQYNAGTNKVRMRARINDSYFIAIYDIILYNLFN
jgi:hypothetical protein